MSHATPIWGLLNETQSFAPFDGIHPRAALESGMVGSVTSWTGGDAAEAIAWCVLMAVIRADVNSQCIGARNRAGFGACCTNRTRTTKTPTARR